MNTSAVFESAGLSLRKVQQDYIEAAAGALTQDHKVALISAETGVGKNAGLSGTGASDSAEKP